MLQIAPSILAADFARLGAAVQAAEAAGAEAIEYDVMDGRFVPQITFGAALLAALRPLTEMKLNVHLMIVEPEKQLAAFAAAGADCIIVHQETCPHLHGTLQAIRKLGLQAGVALNPGTPLSAIEEVLDLADLVHVMTVNPGYGGQKFLDSQLDKIRRARQLLDARGLTAVPVAVDGGINLDTASLVTAAGARLLVAGSSVYNENANVTENVAALRAAALSGIA